MCFKMLGDKDKHISHSPNVTLKIAVGRSPLSFWITSSATALPFVYVFGHLPFFLQERLLLTLHAHSIKPIVFICM